jgi:hypothetical protein
MVYGVNMVERKVGQSPFHSKQAQSNASKNGPYEHATWFGEASVSVWFPLYPTAHTRLMTLAGE